MQTLPELNGISSRLNPPRSELWLTLGAGWGSSGTAIRRWTNVVKKTGSSFLYLPSAVNGDAIQILESGLYAISYQDEASASNQEMGISVNSTQLSTSIASVVAPARKAAVNTPGANIAMSLALTLELAVGDLVRVHTNTGLSGGSNTYQESFRITKLSI